MKMGRLAVCLEKAGDMAQVRLLEDEFLAHFFNLNSLKTNSIELVMLCLLSKA